MSTIPLEAVLTTIPVSFLKNKAIFLNPYGTPIPNPQNKTDFAIGVAREYLMSFLSQASIQAAQQAAREAAVVANQAVLDSVVTVEVAP